MPKEKGQARRKRFAREYLKDLNGTAAAKRAGYSPRTAKQQASALLTKPDVQAVVAQHLEREDISAQRILQELGRLALLDPIEYWDAHGNLKAVRDLSPAARAALAGFEIIIKNAEAGDGITDKVHKIKFWDKTRALEMLAKYHKLLTDVVRVENIAQQIAELDDGRALVAAAKRERDARVAKARKM